MSRKQPVCLNYNNVPYIEFPFDIIYHVSKKTLNGNDRYLRVMINGNYLKMEVDTGSEVTRISKYAMENLNLAGCSEIKRCSLVVANGQSVSCVNTSVFVKYRELDRLVKVGYCVPVDTSQWHHRKSDNSVRLCGDYMRTLNPNLDMMVYPLPTVEDCFVEMKGGQHFSKHIIVCPCGSTISYWQLLTHTRDCINH